MSQAIEGLLSELISSVREQTMVLNEIRSNLQQARPASDAESDLVRSLAATMGGKSFVCAQLIGVSAMLEGVRMALDRLGVTDARRLGKVLQRLEGREFDGIQIIRVGEDAAGAIWCLKGLEGVRRSLPHVFKKAKQRKCCNKI